MTEKLYETLRFEKTTSQLKELARTLDIDISDVPDNRHKKETIVPPIFHGGKSIKHFYVA